ncbi:hypothetical protein [Burkholderia ubonensis]|uniref:hypothetical protein n=1 Tax=Burkholderia ubonensis TaxID=101571 RepID=UPI000A53EF57|nr:hypothetical protein [Burkholderia ubonensis]
MSEDRDSQIGKALGALGALERATEFQTFLLLSSFSLSLNIALTWSHQINLVGFSWQYVKSSISIGQALIFLCGYALFMSYIVEVLRYFADQLVSGPAIWAAVRLQSGEAGSGGRWRPNNRVRPSELLDAAKNEGDDSYVDLYRDHEDKKRAENAAAWRSASLSFGLLILIIFDLTLPAGCSLSIKFVEFLNSACHNLGDVSAILVVGILVFSWIFRFVEDDLASDWVLCPKLYKKLELIEQEREAKKIRESMRR